MDDHGNFFCFGLGYSGQVIARNFMSEGWSVAGTCRDSDTADQLSMGGISTYIFDGASPLADFNEIMAGVSHLLISTPPSAVLGDPVLHCHQDQLAKLKSLQWIGYLSTTGVYGDTGGHLVDETARLMPTSERSQTRVSAEQAWQDLLATNGLPLHIFRLSGIYGPGRCVLDTVRAGKARQIVKPDHKFSRIHVEDIANVVRTSVARPNPGAIYNLCDDEAAPPSDVTEFACDLLNIAPPPPVSFEDAKAGMSTMALSFWNDNRLIDNTRIKVELVTNMLYPTYREGLRQIYAAEGR